jgi:predicted DCC family thiol-disulfide oxidoreductase YuxK
LNQASFSESARETGTASPGKLAVLFDGACGTCRQVAEQMRRFDNSGALELLDLHSPAVRARFPSLQLDHLLEELHVVDDAGRVYRGARAINQILRFQNGLKRYLAYLWYLPGFAWVADRQYKRIAASRYK